MEQSQNTPDNSPLYVREFDVQVGNTYPFWQALDANGGETPAVLHTCDAGLVFALLSKPDTLEMDTLMMLFDTAVVGLYLENDVAFIVIQFVGFQGDMLAEFSLSFNPLAIDLRSITGWQQDRDGAKSQLTLLCVDATTGNIMSIRPFVFKPALTATLHNYIDRIRLAAVTTGVGTLSSDLLLRRAELVMARRSPDQMLSAIAGGASHLLNIDMGMGK